MALCLVFFSFRSPNTANYWHTVIIFSVRARRPWQPVPRVPRGGPQSDPLPGGKVRRRGAHVHPGGHPDQEELPVLKTAEVMRNTVIAQRRKDCWNYRDFTP